MVVEEWEEKDPKKLKAVLYEGTLRSANFIDAWLGEHGTFTYNDNYAGYLKIPSRALSAWVAPGWYVTYDEDTCDFGYCSPGWLREYYWRPDDV